MKHSEIFEKSDSTLFQAIFGFFEFIHVFMNNGLAHQTHELELVTHVFHERQILKNSHSFLESSLVKQENALVVHVNIVFGKSWERVGALKRVGNIEGLFDLDVVWMQLQKVASDHK